MRAAGSLLNGGTLEALEDAVEELKRHDVEHALTSIGTSLREISGDVTALRENLGDALDDFGDAADDTWEEADAAWIGCRGRRTGSKAPAKGSATPPLESCAPSTAPWMPLRICFGSGWGR